MAQSSLVGNCAIHVPIDPAALLDKPVHVTNGFARASAIAALVASAKPAGEVPTSSTILYVPAIFLSSFTDDPFPGILR